LTVWYDRALRSPVSGKTLRLDTPHSLSTGHERWPVVDDIPFLRADRRSLADAALERLDGGEPEEALLLLLADQDNWARSAPPDELSRRKVLQNADRLSFRSAMDLLAFGPVGTYFAHRWSDPTFLSGLALAEAHRLPGPVLELACGAGHFLREFARTGETATGGDIVFAKLWLARRYVSQAARLICFDAAEPWPFADGAFETVFCHDAFYFLPAKPHVATEMRRVGRCVLVGHAHNALVDNLSSGQPMTPDGYAGLFEGAVLYDDRELTAALVEMRVPRAGWAADLAEAPALSWAVGAGPARAVLNGMAMPSSGAALRRNPLYRNGAVVWPSARYEKEYAALATYPLASNVPEAAVMGTDPGTDTLARCRALVDLPSAW